MPLKRIEVKQWNEADTLNITKTSVMFGTVEQIEKNADITNVWLSDQILKKDEETPIFGQQIQPIISMFKLAGTLPINLVDRKWRFRWLSLISLYSVCVYCIVSTLIVFIIRDARMKYDQLDNFDDKMYLQFFSILLVPYCFTPLGMWRDARNMAQYLNEWSEFQTQYVEVTCSEILDTRQVIIKIYWRVSFFIAGFSFVGSQIMPPNLPVWQAPAVFVIALYGCAVFGYYISLFSSLSHCGRELVKSFQKDFVIDSSMRAPRKQIRNYELLWLSLSRLANQLGCSSFRTLSSVMGFAVLYITLSFYQLVSSLLSENIPYGKTALHASNTFVNVIPVYLFCNRSYLSMLEIQLELKKHLWEMNLSDAYAFFTDEISTFLRTIHDNPPSIYVGRFVKLDRYLLQSIAATIVTYLIYVVQIRMSSSDFGV